MSEPFIHSSRSSKNSYLAEVNFLLSPGRRANGKRGKVGWRFLAQREGFYLSLVLRSYDVLNFSPRAEDFAHTYTYHHPYCTLQY